MRLLFSLSLCMSLVTPWILLADDEPNIKLSTSYNHVNRAKFRHTSSERHHHLTFDEGYVLGTYKHKLASDRKLVMGVGYLGTKFHFTHHPRRTSFDEKHFSNLLLQFGGWTKEIENWKWQAGVGLQINTEHFHLSRYTFFTGLLHGKYNYVNHSRLHVGLLGYSGLRYTRVLPIIGFDYPLSAKWELNAVFPLNMSLVYRITNQWQVDAGIRYFLTRQRLGEHEHFRRGFVAYRNWGAEMGLNYEVNEHIRFNIHVGDSFAGRMRISNHRDHDRQHLKLDSALYYGCTAAVAF